MKSGLSIKKFVPAPIKRKLRLFVRQNTYRKKLVSASLEHVSTNGAAFAHGYQLQQESYFQTYDTWKQRRKEVASDERMSLQHYAMLDFLKSNPLPKDARFIDVCCGLGHLFIYLKLLCGYSDFTGVDDSKFQPRVTDAARGFLKYYSVLARIEDFNIGFAHNYFAAGLNGKYDVFSHFGVDTYYLYPIAYKVLKPGGLYIAELEDPNPGIYSDCFEVIKVCEGYGRVGDTGAHPYNIVIMRRK